MANFNVAYSLTIHTEAGYANNPADHGGETYAGIARKFWPAWGGWIIIDAIKDYHGHDAKIIDIWALKDLNLKEQIYLFYKANFWDQNKLDEFNDQQVANSVYDFGVNAGIATAAKMLQEMVGVIPDGIIGRLTLEAVNSRDAKENFEGYNIKRRAYYLNIATNPSQHQFLASWLSRLTNYT